MANFTQPEYTTVDGVKYANYKTYSGNRNLKGVGVDVFWTEELHNEYLKCAEDPIYFIEKYVKIVHVDRGIIPFKMWPFQRDLVKCLHENRMVLGKLARQCGKSQTTASYLLWHILFHPVKSWAVLANKDATAKEILNQKLQVSYELLPFWLQQGVVSWNKGSIELENKSRVLTAATSSGGIRGCVPTESKITVRDKNTGVVSTIDIGELAFSLNNNTKICENGLIYVEDVIRE